MVDIVKNMCCIYDFIFIHYIWCVYRLDFYWNENKHIRLLINKHWVNFKIYVICSFSIIIFVIFTSSTLRYLLLYVYNIYYICYECVYIELFYIIVSVIVNFVLIVFVASFLFFLLLSLLSLILFSFNCLFLFCFKAYPFDIVMFQDWYLLSLVCIMFLCCYRIALASYLIGRAIRKLKMICKMNENTNENMNHLWERNIFGKIERAKTKKQWFEIKIVHRLDEKVHESFAVVSLLF